MTPDKNSLRTVSVMFCWVTNNIKISVAYNKHILMLPGMQCGCRAIDLSWDCWVRQDFRLLLGARSPLSIFILEPRLKTAIAERSSIHGSQEHRSLYGSSGYFLLKTSEGNLHAISIHIPLTKASHFTHPKIKGAGIYAPPIVKGTVKLHGKECGCLILTHRRRVLANQ